MAEHRRADGAAAALRPRLSDGGGAGRRAGLGCRRRDGRRGRHGPARRACSESAAVRSIVPVLFEVFRLLGVPEEVRMQLCVGTSLAIIVPTTVRSYRAHRAKGLVVPAVMRSWALPAVIGVAAGSVTAAFAPAQVFELAFVVIAGVIAAKAPRRPRRLGPRQKPAGTRRDDRVRFYRRTRVVTDGDQRRLARDDDDDALRRADPQRRRDLGRPRRSDHDRRHARLPDRRPASSGLSCRLCRSASSR